jgi:hypothetical protein
MNDALRFLAGIAAIMVIIGAYQVIYLLNNHLKGRLSEQARKQMEDDVRRFGSCCGNTESCTLPARLESLRKQVEDSLPESIVETSAGGKKE